jgi:hypothetical protein
MVMRELVVWRELLSQRFGYAPCVKVDGRWYWAYHAYECFKGLFDDDLGGMGFAQRRDHSQLPEGLEQYASVNNNTEETYFNLKTYLPDLTLDALSPMMEDVLHMWLLEGRCPQCDAKGYRYNKKHATFSTKRDGTTLTVKCELPGCGHERAYKVLPHDAAVRESES